MTPNSVSNPTGYFNPSFKVTRPQFERVEKLLKPYNADTARLIKHVAACQLQRLARGESSDSVPVCYLLIKKKSRRAFDDIGAVLDAGMLERSDYSRLAGLSREYRSKLVEEINFNLNSGGFEEYLGAEKLNIHTGRRMSGPTARSRTVTDTNHSEPTLIVAAINQLSANRGLVNLNAGVLYLLGMQEMWLAMLRAGHDARSEKLYRQLIAAKACLKSILDQNPVRQSGDTYTYDLAYTAGNTGRIHQRMGGAQTAARPFKRALYSGIPDLKNYDIQASHPNAFLFESSIAGTRNDWISDYITNPNRRREYAEMVGISEDVWKTIFCAFMYGSSPRTTRFEYPGGAWKLGAIFEELLKAAGGDEPKAKLQAEKFATVVAPLGRELNEWWAWLKDKHLPAIKQHNRLGWYIVNATGKKLFLDELRPGEMREKVTAHIFQGNEASFVHHLTLLGTAYSYKIVSNEHDGAIITGGAIPDAAIVEAKRLSGQAWVTLTVKPL